MSFGFSVGDFVAALQLVGTVIQSVSEVGGAKAEFRELVQQLYSLQSALLKVKQLEFDVEQEADYLALRQAASQCQFTIHSFWKRAGCFQRDLGSDSRGVKSTWMQIRWTLCKKDDLIRFRADLAAHTEAIALILATLQMKQDRRQKMDQQSQFIGLHRTIHDAARQCYEKLTNISAAINLGAVQGSKILQSSAKILHTNLRIFQVVSAIQEVLLTRIPNQIDRDQPVYMIDALGKISPFHLEFVRSAEALKAVLLANFKSVPSGCRKIQNGEFIIKDATNGRLIDLSDDWAACFAPGQRVDMRVVFEKTVRKQGVCPSCQTPHRPQYGADIQCNKCGLILLRIVETRTPSDTPTSDATKVVVKHLALMSAANTAATSLTYPLLPKTAFDEAEDVRFYRRIHLLEHQRRIGWSGDTDPDAAADASSELKQDAIRAIPAQNLNDIRDSNEALQDIVDTDVLTQILEMCDDDDDDGVDLEFARLLFFGGLAAIIDTFKNIKAKLQERDFRVASGLAHAMKGASNGIGLRQLQDIAETLQFYDYGEGHFETRPTPWELCESFERELGYIIEKMGTYFRVDPEVELMEHGP